ncbi:ABC transporter permease subunit [Mucisphaera calidilacus]|uniref:Phosphate transport system permease protein PstC n=1 Tax=Mucisphaera calidilacus TaxID=2527982 RepID=A0A518BVY0_9BACT|nr:ABC transporter permease subunit [Mucisphaera calidilacus]QDU71129.1 Phosphate transport system permease protein PstC [Mucisphaera calidilacus]
MTTSRQFTGRVRRKTTGLSTRFVDRVAQLLITIGGIGTIVAVSLVAVFLALVTLPLFLSPHADEPQTVAAAGDDSRPLWLSVDEYQLLALTGRDNGSFQAIDLTSGQTIDEQVPFPDKRLTAHARWDATDSVVLGFGDGSFAIGTVGFKTRFMDVDRAPQAIQNLQVGESLREGKRIAARIDETQVRTLELITEFEQAIRTDNNTDPILLIDRATGSTLGDTIVLLTEKRDTLRVVNIRRIENLMTGKVTLRPRTTTIPFKQRDNTTPIFLGVTALGDNAFIVWDDGCIDRYDLRSADAPGLAERVTPPIEGRATTATMLIGRETLLVGTESGQTLALFRIRSEDSAVSDGFRLVHAHTLGEHPSPVVSLNASTRSRLIVVGHEDGHLELSQVTSGVTILPPSQQASPLAVCFAPKEDGILAWTNDGIVRWPFSVRHPEASIRSLFLPVWYEGYDDPQHVWQSSGATDAHEPKLGLMPLVFGTIKATIFAMIFATPIALLAAIYSSEYLSPHWRGRIKPTLEMMASLPSVVLGFMGGLVIAPFVETRLPEAIGVCLVTPLALITGAYLWNLLPESMAVAARRKRLIGVVAALLAGAGIGWLSGNPIETFLFAGDIKRWLDGQIGGPFAGLFLLLLPLGLLASAVWGGQILTDILRSTTIHSVSAAARLNLLKWLAIVAIGLALSAVAAFVLAAFGVDPRPSLIDTYVQRNAMIVGFVMGFAVIPIIYTIADDALTAVPNHLRSASLGAGATPWQTTVRVVMPIAASGLFSALMIGLGRAVGETMIVLMAAGNTPVMDINPFNGFRTMSANIAVELPEAVRDSTHYRTLFLTALLLFVMTFVLNTVAEIVRARFRKRAQVL